MGLCCRSPSRAKAPTGESPLQIYFLTRFPTTASGLLWPIQNSPEAAFPVHRPACPARSGVYFSDSGHLRNACSTGWRGVSGRVCVYFAVMPRPGPLMGRCPSHAGG